MARITRQLLPTLLALAALHPGCECQDPDLVELAASAALPADTLDFGEVPVGGRRTLSRTLRNQGTAALQVAAIELSPPLGAFVAEVVPDPVPARGAAELRVTFRPPQEQAFECQLALRTNARTDPAPLGLRGQGVRPAIEVEPTSIDFGDVAFADSEQRAVRIRNLRSLDQEVWLTLQDDGAIHFAVDHGSGGRRTVPADGDIVVELTYTPRHGGPHAAQLRVDSCGEGCGLQVSLRGRCQVPRIVVEPLRLDFGVLPPGATEQRVLSVRNAGFGPLQLDGLRVVLGEPAFALEQTFVPIAIDEGQGVQVQVRFAPEHSGLASGRLEIASSDPASPTGHVELSGQRQGAELVAVPQRLEFGVVRDAGPYTRHLVLVNRGDQVARVLDGQVLGEAFASSLLPSWPLDIAGGGTAVLEVTYAPRDNGTTYGRLLLHSDVPETPLLEVALAGTRAEQSCVLVPSADTLQFGNVLVGSASWQNLTLSNGGDQACLIAGVGVSPLHINDPAFTIEPPSVTAVEPGQQASVRTVFAPTQGGQAKAAVLVRLADASATGILVGLQGSGARAGISAAPPVVDFGTTVASCGTIERAVAIGNIGQVSVNLGFARIESTVNAFSIVEGAWIGELAPGWRHLIHVRYAPTAAGLHSGQLIVDGGAEVAGVVVPLSGEALASGSALVREHFEVTGSDQVDVLFVVDNSGSMQDNQDNLASNFDHFIRYADFLGMAVDYQIAVITTDVYDPQQAGRFVSTPRILRRSTPDLAQRFAESVRVGVVGSGWEQGLEASFLALSPPLIDDPVYNQGFVRPDAALAVVVVSDEDDGSQQPVDAYVGFVLGLKAAQGLPAQFHAVTGGYTGCERSGVWADPAPRYDAAVQQTGGSWADLCAPDWGSQLEDLGAAVFLARGRFQLQGRPDPGTIEVYLDEVLLDPGLWSYDPLSRAVTLAPQALPPAGTSVDITYVMGC